VYDRAPREEVSTDSYRAALKVNSKPLSFISLGCTYKKRIQELTPRCIVLDDIVLLGEYVLMKHIQELTPRCMFF